VDISLNRQIQKAKIGKVEIQGDYEKHTAFAGSFIESCFSLNKTMIEEV
jgi:hypothetical protein